MSETPPHVTDAELGVLRVLWAMGVATIREIRDDLYPGGETSEYGTVQKLLERLEAKDLVRRRRDRIPHTFSATVDRDTLVGHRLTEIAQSLCDGSMSPIVSHLVETHRLSAADRDRLLRLIRKRATPRGKARSQKGNSR